MLLCLSFLVFNFASANINAYSDEAKHSLLTLLDNQLLVTKQKDLNNLKPFNRNEITKLIDKLSLKNIHPYNQTKLVFKGAVYNLFPYYENSNLKNNILIHNKTIKNGLYLGCNARHFVRTYHPSLKQIDASIITFDLRVLDNQVIDISGALVEDYQFAYALNDKDFILMYYQDLEKYYPTNNLNQGYVITINDIDDYFKIKNTLEANGYYICIGMDNMINLENRINWINKIKYLLLSTISLIFIFLITLVQIDYFYKRKHEFALLKINGLSNQDMTKLALFEIIFKIIITFILTIILSITSLSLLKIPFDTVTLVIFDLANAIIIILFTFIFNHHYLNKLIPEKIIRN